MSLQAGSGFADVNGIEVYYEIHGQGEPLVLLHGGMNPSQTYGAVLEELALDRQVIAIHLQGHGKTRDSDRPLSYEQMADDVAALVAQLGIGRASVMGYSMGGGVALQAAVRHPEIVEKLIVVSMPFRQDGPFPEILTAFEQMPANASAIAAGIASSPLGQLYPGVDWESLAKKIGMMNALPYDWTRQVAGIAAPTLLIFADADFIRLEHIAEFYKLLGGGRRDPGMDGSLRTPNRLAIIPGTTHYTLLEAKAVTAFSKQFLAG
jgi:pimeloyl-ACP methyl ester carboxylesterase